jgi:hypothetical protein
MRFIWALLLSGICFAGCRHTPTKDTQAAGSEKKNTRKATTTQGTPTPAGPGAKSSRVVPVNEVAGKIAAVNPALRFVVVDFYSSRLPKTDLRMGVYRQGQKVAEIKITGPEQSHNIAADIIAGDARIGDEVRVD